MLRVPAFGLKQVVQNVGPADIGHGGHLKIVARGRQVVDLTARLTESHNAQAHGRGVLSAPVAARFPANGVTRVSVAVLRTDRTHGIALPRACVLGG